MKDKDCQNNSIFLAEFFLSLFFLLSVGGCSQPLLKHEMRTPSSISYKPIVHIHPNSANLSRASIAVLPFQLPGHIETVRGEEVAALFQQTLLRQQTFHKVKLIPAHYGTLPEAMEIARREKVDLVMAGRINNIIDGSSLGGGRLNLSLRIIDLASSNTVWYLEQTVDQEMTYPDTSLLSRLGGIFSTPPTPGRYSPSVLPIMLASISSDMAKIIKAGNYSATSPPSSR